MAQPTAIITTTKQYIIIKIPRELTERQPPNKELRRVLRIIEAGEREYRAGKLKSVNSLQELL